MNARLWKSAGLLICLYLASAYGQQAVPPPTQSSPTQKKGQIAQPEIKPGKSADAASLLVSFHGCADLILADPRGRRLGYDAAAKKSYQQIPGGIYDEGDLIADDEDDATPAQPEAKPVKPERQSPAASRDCASDKTVQVPQPMAGTYVLSIAKTTGSPFKIEITSYGSNSKQNGHFAASQPASAPGVSTYQFQLPPSSSGGLEIKSR